MPLPVLALLLVACTGDEGDGATGDDSATSTCAIRVEGTLPEDGAMDAYARSPVEFELTEADPFATIEVDGVAGETSFRGTRDQIVVFTPDAPLDPLTSYTATLSWCGGIASVSFSTSEAGMPLEDAASLAGVVFAVPFLSGRIVEPDGAAGVLSEYITQTDLLQVDAVTTGTLSATNALALDGADPPAQDWCVPTTSFDDADFSASPYFALSASENAQIVIAGQVVELQQLVVTGTFLPDGRTIAGGDVRYVLDTRPLAPLVNASDPGSVCESALSFDEQCEPCPDSGEPYCLSFHLDQLTGTAVDGLALATVDGVNCDGCEDAPPADDAVCE